MKTATKRQDTEPKAGRELYTFLQDACPILKLEDVPQDEFCPLMPVLRDLPIGVIISDEQGRFTLFNREAERILGIGAEQVGSAHWSAVYGCYLPDKETPFPSEQLPLARALRGEEVRGELIFIRNPSQPQGAWIRASSRVLKNIPEGEGSAVVVFSDITQQRTAVEKIEQLSRAVEQTADSVVITNNRGVIQYVNPAFEVTTGYTSAEALGNTPRILRSGQHPREFYRDMWAQILRGDPFRGTLVNRKKTGELYWAEQTITAIRDGGGQVSQFVSVLKDITESRKRHEHEIQLQLARQVQQRFYTPPIALPGIEVGTAVYPAVETGGDYIDFIPTSDGSIGIAVGDVSGHGFDSALIMALTRAYVRAFSTQALEVSQTLSAVNTMLVADLEEDRYVTLLLVQLDPAARKLCYGSAGHVPGFVLDRNGEVDFVMDSTGVPLGIFDEYEGVSRMITLKPNSVVVLLTDGVTEAENPDGCPFGFERVVECVRTHRTESAQQLADRICHCVRTFAGPQYQHDDITAVVFKVD